MVVEVETEVTWDTELLEQAAALCKQSREGEGWRNRRSNSGQAGCSQKEFISNNSHSTWHTASRWLP